MSRKSVFVLSLLILALAACGTLSERHVRRGRSYLNSGKLEKAEREFRRAVVHDSTNPDAHFGLGYVFFRQNRLDMAIDEYKRGMAYDPSDPDSHYYLGLVYNEKNLQDEAREEFKLYEKLKRSRQR